MVIWGILMLFELFGAKLVVWLRATQLAWVSSRCKGDACLSQPRPGYSKCTFRYTYHVTTCLPVYSNNLIMDKVGAERGESDGRCVRVSEPNSKGHSVFFLLLNPPLDA